MALVLSLAAYALVFLAGLFAVIYLYFRNQYKTWERLNIPYIKPKFPYGNTEGFGISKPICEVVKSTYEMSAGKPFVGMYMFCSPYILVRDPELIKNILIKDFSYFQDRGMYYNEKDDPLSAHLAALEGVRWKNMRMKLTPTFTSGKMKTMFPILMEKNRGLVELLKGLASKGGVIEIKDYVSRFTVDVISSVAFGIDSNALQNPDAIFRTMGYKIFQPKRVQLSMNIAFFFPEFAKAIRSRFTLPEVADFFMGAFRETMTYRKENNVKKEDFLQLLMQLMDKGRLEDDKNRNGEAKLEESSKLTFEQAAAQAFIFFAGGFETSSSLIQFALYELSLNPDIQETLREEITKVLEEHDSQITFEGIYKMEYLGRVIDEALRKYPPNAFLFRRCVKNYRIPNTEVVIPAGSRIQIPVYGLHTDPEIYPNPEKFDPDRFTEEEKSKRHNCTYVPFGEGQRICIGMRFALMVTRACLIALLSKYRFEVTETTPIPMTYDKQAILQTPATAVNLKISNL